jgi:curved DNA-binding protein
MSKKALRGLFSIMDHYKTLGVDRSASAEEIKRAYRRLASQHHPDKGGDTKTFQEIESAYRVLSDAQSRAEYDNPRRRFHEPGPGFDFEEIFNMFGTRFHMQRPQQQARMVMWLHLADLVKCQNKTVQVTTPAGTSTLDLEIPAGIEDAQQVAYQGLAPGNLDLVVQYRIHADATWQRSGSDISTDCPISIWDLIGGTRIKVRDPAGTELEVAVPPRSQPNTQLRLRGGGLARRGGGRGDALVRLVARIPDYISPNLLSLIDQER